MVGWTIKHITSIAKAVQSNSSSAIPTKFIFLRFIATLLAQVLITIYPLRV